MTSHIIQSYASFNKFIVEKIAKLLNKICKQITLTNVLSHITAVDTYKTIFIIIIINKQDNDKFKLKKSFYFNRELDHFHLCRQADCL